MGNRHPPSRPCTYNTHLARSLHVHKHGVFLFQWGLSYQRRCMLTGGTPPYGWHLAIGCMPNAPETNNQSGWPMANAPTMGHVAGHWSA